MIYLFLVRSVNAPWTLLRRSSLALLALLPVSFCFAASPQVTIPQDATALVLTAPRPEYAVEAQLRRERGSGVFLVRAKIKSGRVTQVIVARTTGYKLLDDAAVKALRHWWFKPGALVHREITKPRLTPPVAADECLVLVPLTFKL